MKEPFLATNIPCAKGYKSVKDKDIIIPAEKERANVRSFLLFNSEKNTIKLPITVDKPAKSDIIKAKSP